MNKTFVLGFNMHQQTQQRGSGKTPPQMQIYFEHIQNIRHHSYTHHIKLRGNIVVLNVEYRLNIIVV